MAIDLHWGEFIYSHHALVLPVFSLTGLLCGVQYRALRHAPAVSAQAVQRKYRTMLKDSRWAWRGANDFSLCVLHQLVSFPVVRCDITLGEQNILCRHKKVTGIMIARSEIKVQSKHWNSITCFLELGKVPLVNYALSSKFVLNANAVLRSVVPV